MNYNFEVEQTSINILKTLLPSSWRFREQHPDIHIDYVVEIPPGLFFAIQLKGRRKLTLKKNYIKIQFATKQLKYYLDDIKTFPVFIIVVDVVSRMAYWLFIQEYLKEKIINKHWRSQKSVTLSISAQNTIENIEVFKDKIVEANNYIKELWPSSLLASAKKETEYFKSLDPRFKDISINIKNNDLNYHFHSDESFDIKFKVKDGIKLQEYLTNPEIEKIIFKSNDVEIIGSDLMNELLKRTDKIEFKLKPKEFDVDVFMLIMDDKENFSEMLNLNGHLVYKNKIIRINCTQKESPLNIKIVLNTALHKNPIFDFNFDFTPWIDKSIKFLPFLEKFNSYFSKVGNGKDVLVKIESMGKELLSAKLKIYDNIEFLDYIKNIFSFLGKLKVVDEYYQLNLLCPDISKIRKDDVYDIEELYDLITTGKHIEKRRKSNVNIEVKRKENFQGLFSKGFNISLISDGSYILLGKEINIGKYEIDISNPKLLISNTELKKLLKSNKEYIPLKFTTDKNSIVVIRKLDDKI